MAHTTTADTQRRTEGTSSVDSAIGWIIAAIVLVAIVVGGFFLLRNTGGSGTVAPETNTMMEVSLPSGGEADGTPVGTGGTDGTGVGAGTGSGSTGGSVTGSVSY